MYLINILVRRQIVKFFPGVGALFPSRPSTPAGFSLYDSSCVVETFYPGVPVTIISPSHRCTLLSTLRETVRLAKVAVDAFINVFFYISFECVNFYICCFFAFYISFECVNFYICCFFRFLHFFRMCQFLHLLFFSLFACFRFFSIFVRTLSYGMRFHQNIYCHFIKYCLWRNPK
jgi:hypothetical protein